MPKFEVRELEWIAGVVVRLILWVEPAGGQAVARRNAWSSLVQDNRRRVERLEAERAVAERRVTERTALDQPREMAVV